MDYTIFRNALNELECSNFLQFGKDQYPLLKPNQLYPNRGYPGFTLKNADSILDKLTKYVSLANYKESYDRGPGTGVNFINAEPGETLDQHIDKPLYEFDQNYQIKSEFENRYCALSVLACIGGINTLVIEDADIVVSTGDVIVLKGFTAHAMKSTEKDTFYLLSAFLCYST